MVKTLFYGTDLDGRLFDPIADLLKSFGGPERIINIKRFLDRLRYKNANIKLVSTSWAPVTEKQWQEYLINVTNTFDLGFKNNDVLSLEDPGPGIRADYGEAIRRDMEYFDLGFNEALFAGDGIDNIKSAKGVCNTLLLPKNVGLDQTDCAYIEALVSHFQQEVRQYQFLDEAP